MDARGLITRTRDAANRRVQVVTLTEAGEAAFLRLRETAIAFDTKLRTGLTNADLATLGTLLSLLASNVGHPRSHHPALGRARRPPELTAVAAPLASPDRRVGCPSITYNRGIKSGNLMI